MTSAESNTCGHDVMAFFVKTIGQADKSALDEFAAVRKARLTAGGNTTKSNRTNSGWHNATMVTLSQAVDILGELRKYWPLTLRQLFYQLVQCGYIPNNQTSYHRLMSIVAKGRIQGYIDWGAIEDRSRSTQEWQTDTDADSFIDWQREAYFAPDTYNRDLRQTQEQGLEIWVEKDALMSLVARAAEPYQVPVVAARGYASVSYKHECATRINQRFTNKGQTTKILYLGDFDPSGMDMLPAMIKTMTCELGVGSAIVQSERVALNPEQVDTYDLPNNPDALKKSDSRAKEFIAKYGDVSVELDALSPEDLMQVVADAIERNTTMVQFEAELEGQDQDRRRIAELKDQIDELLQEI